VRLFLGAPSIDCGAALAAMYFGFAAKAAPTSGKIIVVFNAKLLIHNDFGEAE
jgi:hypothetical protein